MQEAAPRTYGVASFFFISLNCFESARLQPRRKATKINSGFSRRA